MKHLRHLENLETDAGIANAEAGYVVLDGPDGIAMTLTADAAMKMGESLISAANIALKQARETPGSEPDRIY